MSAKESLWQMIKNLLVIENEVAHLKEHTRENSALVKEVQSDVRRLDQRVTQLEAYRQADKETIEERVRVEVMKIVIEEFEKRQKRPDALPPVAD